MKLLSLLPALLVLCLVTGCPRPERGQFINATPEVIELLGKDSAHAVRSGELVDFDNGAKFIQFKKVSRNRTMAQLLVRRAGVNREYLLHFRPAEDWPQQYSVSRYSFTLETNNTITVRQLTDSGAPASLTVVIITPSE